MTVKELIEQLSKYPEDTPVSVKTDDYYGTYSEANTVVLHTDPVTEVRIDSY